MTVIVIIIITITITISITTTTTISIAQWHGTAVRGLQALASSLAGCVSRTRRGRGSLDHHPLSCVETAGMVSKARSYSLRLVYPASLSGRTDGRTDGRRWMGMAIAPALRRWLEWEHGAEPKPASVHGHASLGLGQPLALHHACSPAASQPASPASQPSQSVNHSFIHSFRSRFLFRIPRQAAPGLSILLALPSGDQCLLDN
ncbi:hypothetical protein BD289DRAFT_32537 [Coniella lustricola]|uniref:Uncharacterized protein n=1 Tax=Coniella lustricola TaxID=2025994 RepID=A0A2T3A2K2_9PEZI|nr:hypothetical protein BD289DRAFT_32537 [Coniella lustricola]